MRARLLRHIEAAGDLQTAAFLALLLSRHRAGATEVRADRLEQSVRIQRDGFAYQRAAAQDLARSVRRCSVHRIEVPDWYPNQIAYSLERVTSRIAFPTFLFACASKTVKNRYIKNDC